MEYATYDADHMARAKMTNVGVSTKHSIEICSAIRGKPLSYAIAYLKRVVKKEQPVKYTRFNAEGAGHKPGIGPGRYPVNTAKEFIILLESVKSNAADKSFNEDALRIVHIKADRASRPYHPGRHRGRLMKRSHLEVIVAEDEILAQKMKKVAPKKKSAAKAPAQDTAAAPKKAPAKKAAPKIETKKETSEPAPKAAPAKKESPAAKSTPEEPINEENKQ